MPEPGSGVKRGDLFPPLAATLQKYNATTERWEAIDLTEAASVTVYLRSTNYPGTVVTGLCTFAGLRTAGGVEYAWVAGDTDLADIYTLEFAITWSNGKKQTVPNVGYFSYRIEPNLKDPE